MEQENLICPHCGKFEGSRMYISPEEYLYGSFKTQQEIIHLENINRIYNASCKCGQVFYSALKKYQISKCAHKNCTFAFKTNIPSNMVIIGVFADESMIPPNILYDGLFINNCDFYLSDKLNLIHSNNRFLYNHRNVVITRFIKSETSSNRGNISMEI